MNGQPTLQPMQPMYIPSLPNGTNATHAQAAVGLLASSLLYPIKTNRMYPFILQDIARKNKSQVAALLQHYYGLSIDLTQARTNIPKEMPETELLQRDQLAQLRSRDNFDEYD